VDMRYDRSPALQIARIRDMARFRDPHRPTQQAKPVGREGQLQRTGHERRRR